ncbi:1,2-phenylacetyl-CoA epoxidase subunit PaaD [Streptomyces boncukensis]|uniref:Phenylacetate-CoA oxygenase subunit PaaJ n=1 Tax=Streptomyces boncukensis TaxID=2711219 RepID=A0A6G4X8C0_9ACTN|nr:1,2-phenylacetyl-CoA epoxidase subunit PaaD [Streptomyces boncukensis]NGO73100.1 phenylacetate-CoA oxygenase subunit PaaJ [Streptomyces boncukensis]
MVTAHRADRETIGPDQAPAQAPGRPLDLAVLAALAGSVPDPELPMVTLAELGVVRRVSEPEPGRVEVELTPTYTGCPAVESMAEDIERALWAYGQEHGGLRAVTVRTVLTPPWSTDDITDSGRRKLAEHGIAPPRRAGPGEPAPAAGPVPIGLGPTRRRTPRAASRAYAEPVRCPHCGSADTVELSRFSATACKALRRCTSCQEPFDHFKEL